MTEALRGWIIGIVGAAMVSALTLTVTPEGRVRRVVAVVCGFVMLLALIKPIKGFDYVSFSRSLLRLREDAGELAKPALQANENLTKKIIEERCAAYIVDKSRLLGIPDLQAEVEAELGADGRWYPARVSAATEAGKSERDALAYEIEAGLGVPPDKLNFRDRGDG